MVNHTHLTPKINFVMILSFWKDIKSLLIKPRSVLLTSKGDLLHF